MPSAKPIIITLPDHAEARLQSLGLSTEIIQLAARRAAAARAQATPEHPPGTAGMKSYHAGVHTLRLELQQDEHWRLSNDNNVAAIVNDELGVQLLFQNVDRACDVVPPRSNSPKGDGTRNLVAAGQMDFFNDAPPVVALKSKHGSTPIVWLLCVSVNGTKLHAEVSCPRPFDGSQYGEFSERIFVVDDDLDQMPEATPKGDDDAGDTTFDFDIPVSKK